MDNIQDTAAAIRIMESGGDYHAQQLVRIDGTQQRKVGAYGLVESNIPRLLDALGIPGADWRDRAVQDTIAKEALERSYRELENWDLAAIAFRYGMPIARHLKEQGNVEPKDIETAGYKSVGQYLRDMRRRRPNRDLPVEGRMAIPEASTPDVATPPDGTQQGRDTSPNRKRSEDIVRNQLVSMRNAERNRAKMMRQEVSDGGNEEQQPE